ncbi:MAG: hypothetical protein EWV41_00620 [Microcystis wesenbergii Mw_MB_S_20031200_S109]|nr:MAG: hypothetical protein EWV41_00620 [Microcystis wesenbergii Mw_MB_S_20031200_S109]
MEFYLIKPINLKKIDGFLKPIYYLEHPVGSGKTEAVLREIADQQDRNYIYACPTKDLSAEVGRRLEGKGRAGIRILNSATKPQGKRSIVKWVHSEILKKPLNGTSVFIITTETFVELLSLLDDWTKREFYVFIDEGLDPIKPIEFTTRELGIYRPYFNVGPDEKFSIADGYKGDIDKLLHDRKGLKENKLGHLDVAGFKEICKLIEGPTYDVYGKIGDNSVEVIGFLNPKALYAFASITFIVAIFNQSVLALCLRHLHGCDLQELLLDFDYHDTHRECGPRMEIFHLLSGADTASQNKLNMRLPEEQGGQIVASRIAEIVSKEFAGRDYCWTINAGFDAIEATMEEGRYMPMKCHGLNGFQECDAVAMLGSANPTPWQGPILKQLLGLDDDKLFEVFNLSPVYQAVGRCGIRDRKFQGQISVVVLGSREAEKLARIFQGAQFRGQMGDIPRLGRQNRNMKYTRADNNAYYKYRKSCDAKGVAALPKDNWFGEFRQGRLAQQLG